MRPRTTPHDSNDALPEQDDGCLSVLHLAAQAPKDPPAFTRHLLAHGASLHAVDRNRRSPLFCALMVSSEDICALMIASGARFDAKDSNGYCPLRLMMIRFNADSLYRLVQAMDSQQLQCAGEGVALMQAKDSISTPLYRFRFMASDESVATSKINASNGLLTVAMVQARQAALAIDQLTAPPIRNRETP